MGRGVGGVQMQTALRGSVWEGKGRNWASLQKGRACPVELGTRVFGEIWVCFWREGARGRERTKVLEREHVTQGGHRGDPDAAGGGLGLNRQFPPRKTACRKLTPVSACAPGRLVHLLTENNVSARTPAPLVIPRTLTSALPKNSPRRKQGRTFGACRVRWGEGRVRGRGVEESGETTIFFFQFCQLASSFLTCHLKQNYHPVNLTSRYKWK